MHLENNIVNIYRTVYNTIQLTLMHIGAKFFFCVILIFYSVIKLSKQIISKEGKIIITVLKKVFFNKL